jgi:hypothetical protein
VLDKPLEKVFNILDPLPFVASDVLPSPTIPHQCSAVIKSLVQYSSPTNTSLTATLPEGTLLTMAHMARLVTMLVLVLSFLGLGLAAPVILDPPRDRVVSRIHCRHVATQSNKVQPVIISSDRPRPMESPINGVVTK